MNSSREKDDSNSLGEGTSNKEETSENLPPYSTVFLRPYALRVGAFDAESLVRDPYRQEMFRNSIPNRLRDYVKPEVAALR